MSQIKVAHITTVAGSLRDLLLNQLIAIKRSGFDVTGISSPGTEVSSITQAGIRHIPVSMSRRITPLADLVSVFRVFQVIRKERFTIVHTHNPKPGLLGQMAAKMANIPIVVNTLHGFYFHEYMPSGSRRFYITMEKIAARCSDKILSQNKEDIGTAIRERICTPAKIAHLGNGIDLRLFNPERFSMVQVERKKKEIGIGHDSPVVGFVGRLAAKRKGFLDFLAAGKQLIRREPRTRFLIVGEADRGKVDAVTRSAVADYEIADACLFLGQRPNQELPLIYRTMNVLVLPSLFEGLPRAVMEASAMGVPVVASDVKGNREAVEHGNNGFLVPLHDVRALTEAIWKILVNNEMAMEMEIRGRWMAKERFDERLVFEKVLAEYERLLHCKGLICNNSSFLIE